METKLVVVGGKANRREIRLKLPAVLGRGQDADLTVAHPLVSRHHCRLEEVDGALVLRDNNSTNGTFVGKKRITQVVLKPGDQFTVGPLTFKADYKHSGGYPNIGGPAPESGAAETAGDQQAGGEASDLDFTVAFESFDAAKASEAKPKSKPAETKAKAPPAEKKPQAKPADKGPQRSGKSEPERIQPATAATSADDAGLMDWLAEPAAFAPAEPEPLADFDFGDEPVAAVAAPEAGPAEEIDLPASPAAEPEAEVLDWLEEPTAKDASSEPGPLADLGFGDEPVAAVAAPEAGPAEEIDLPAPPAAESEAEVLDWLEEPTAKDASSEPEPLADFGFDDEPVAAEALPEESPAEEADAIALPAADADAGVLDWLDEPPASAPQAEAEPLGDIVFGEEPVAAEMIVEMDDGPAAAEALPEESPAEEADLIALPAADAEAGVLDWLDEPPATAPQAETEPLGDIEFGEEPVAAAPVIEDIASAEPEAAAEPAADVMDWLGEPEPRAAHSEVESLESLSFDEEPVPAEPLAEFGMDEEPVAAEALPEAALVEESPAGEADLITLPAADAEAGVLDWLDEPPATAPQAEVEPLADIEFGEEPVAAEMIVEMDEEPVAAETLPEAALVEESPAEEAELISLPAADPEAGVLDWLDEPPATAPQAEAEPPADIEFGEAPVAAEPLAEFGMDEEPVAAEALPEAALVDESPAGEADLITLPAADAEAGVLDWLDEPPATAPQAEVEPLGDIVFGEEPVAAEMIVEMDEEPVAAEALPEAALVEESPADEAELISLPAADPEAGVLDWLDEPPATSPQAEAEPLADIEFGEAPVAAEPIIEEIAPAEPEPAADVMDWLGEPEPRAAHSEVESPGSLSFDEEPVPAEPLAEFGMDEEPVAAEALPEAALVDESPAGEADLITLPAADADAGVLDWLDEPPATAPQAEAEPLGDIVFDEEPVAAEMIVEMDEEPVPAEALPEAALVEESPAEEADLISLPADDAEADMLDWLDEPEPRAAHSEVESLESLSFDEEPVPAEALPGASLPEEPPAETAGVEEADLIASPAADAETGMLDWLEEPTAADSPVEAEPLVDFGLDEVPVAAEPFDATPDDPESELITPPLAESDDMTAFWTGDTTTVDPQLADEASDEMEFDFGDEAEPDAALGEPMFMDEDAVDAEPMLPDEALGLDMNLGMDDGAADLDATEMFDASEMEQKPALAEPADFSDDDAFASPGGPGEEFGLPEVEEVEETAEFDFLAGDAPAPAASDFELQDEPQRKLPTPVEGAGTKGAGRGEGAAEKPAKKGWWPFGKSKKKEKPEPKGRKSAAPKTFEPEEIPLAAAESVPATPPEEPPAPAPRSATADTDGTPDFSFADSGHDAPEKSGPDDDLENFFEDLGFK